MSYLSSYGMGAVNDQVAVSQYGGPVGGFSCNTAGGYSLVTPLGYQSAQCMTAAQLAAANAAYALAALNPSAGQAQQQGQQTQSATTGSQGPQGQSGSSSPLGAESSSAGGAGGASASFSGLVSSGVSWIQNNPMLAAAAGIGIVLLVVRR